MFSKEQIYFLSDFLTDQKDDIMEEISNSEMVLEDEEIADDEYLKQIFIDDLKEAKYNKTMIDEILVIIKQEKLSYK